MYMLQYKPFKNNDEQNAYIERARAGDRNAKERIYCSMYPAVKAWVTKYFRYRNSRLDSEKDFDDFMSEAYVGIDMALDSFDPTRGVKFITFCSWYIRNSVNTYYHDKTRLIRVPRNVSILVGASPKKRARANAFTRESLVYARRAMTAEQGQMKYVGKERGEQESYANYNMMVKKIVEWTKNKFKDDKKQRAVYMLFGIKGYDKLPVDSVCEVLDLKKHFVVTLKKQAIARFQVLFAV